MAEILKTPKKGNKLSFNEKIVEETLSNDDDKDDVIGLQRSKVH